MTRERTLQPLHWMTAQRAADAPHSAALAFLDDGETITSLWTNEEVHRLALGYARHLVGHDLKPGSRVIVSLPTGPDFVGALLGCMHAGMIAVPVAPLRPKDRRHFALVDHIAADCSATAILSSEACCRVAASSLEELPHLSCLRWISTFPANSDVSLTGQQSEIAFLQYTSGSTSTPRGVIVKHSNLLANISAIHSKLKVSPDCRVVSWLPLHHDMGLIGSLLAALLAGIPAAFLSPMHFAQKPLRWLRAISSFKATHSGGPDFAYALCAEKAFPPEALSQLDLSSWRFACSGSEPVKSRTINRFCERFGPHGFDRAAFYPCYGLAEATLLAAGPDMNRPTAIRFDPDLLGQGKAVPKDGGTGLSVVSMGGPAEGHEITIVAPETDTILDEGSVGEILISGPSVCDGYWSTPAEHSRTFGSHLADDTRSYLRTGDLGFVFNGDLYVVGRLKDLIIVRGRNVYPQDVEAAASNAVTTAELGLSAAVVSIFAGEQALTVVQEVSRYGGARPEDICQAIVKAIAIALEIRPDRVVLTSSNNLPKTTSGKIRRSETRQLLAQNTLPVSFEFTPQAAR